MKTLVKTISLIAVISLVSVCFCQEPVKSKEKVKEKIKEKAAAKLEVSLKALERQREELERNQEQLERQLMELDRQIETLPTAETPAVPVTEKMSGIFLSKGRGGQSADISADISVVITSEDDQPENISQLTEDMGIMARIFDKEVFEIPVPKRRTVGYGDVSLYMYTDVSLSRTRGIYISEYGALFLMEVDFPLKPEPTEEEKEEEKAEVPDIWERTKGELKGWYQEPGAVKPDIARVRRKAAFDKSKVEELKEKIIKSLKYASNIHGLEPGDDIIVSVKSTGLQGSETRRGIRILNRQIGAQTGGGGTFGGGGYGGGFASGFAAEPAPITGMTIVVDKDAVDEFAEGDIDYEAFCEDVEIFEY